MLTAFYMTRMMFLTFWGEPRWDDGVHPHESPPTMIVPLAALGGLALVGGLVNTPFLDAVRSRLRALPGTGVRGGATRHLPGAGTQLGAGCDLDRRRHRGHRPGRPPLCRAKRNVEEGGIWDTLLAGYRVDDLYGKTFVLPGKRLANVAAFSADAKVVDGAVNGVGAAVKLLAEKLRPIQTGLVRTYGVGILVGVVGSRPVHLDHRRWVVIPDRQSPVAGRQRLHHGDGRTGRGPTYQVWQPVLRTTVRRYSVRRERRRQMTPITLLVLLPVIGAVVVMALPETRPDLVLPVSFAMTIPPLAVALWILWEFQTGDAGSSSSSRPPGTSRGASGGTSASTASRCSSSC